jgi:ribosomal protein S18 acetylase RimI-like enzyme
MSIEIREIDESNARDLNQCDRTFLVDSILKLRIDNDTLAYSIFPISSYSKNYPPTQIDSTSIVFFAYDHGQLAGQIIAHENWNRFAFIDDLTVDRQFRKRGIGRALMARIVDWAKSRQLAGIMIETQNNNVGACKFYERLGFRLAGFDSMLYKAINPDTEEIALYWYLNV